MRLTQENLQTAAQTAEAYLATKTHGAIVWTYGPERSYRGEAAYVRLVGRQISRPEYDGALHRPVATQLAAALAEPRLPGTDLVLVLGPQSWAEAEALDADAAACAARVVAASAQDSRVFNPADDSWAELSGVAHSPVVDHDPAGDGSCLGCGAPRSPGFECPRCR